MSKDLNESMLELIDILSRNRRDVTQVQFLWDGVKNGNSGDKDKLLSLFHPKALGDVYVGEFESWHSWMNYLDEIKRKIENI